MNVQNNKLSLHSLLLLLPVVLLACTANPSGEEKSTGNQKRNNPKKTTSNPKDGETEVPDVLSKSHIRNMNYPELRSFTPPKAKKHTLKNEVPLYLNRDPELPIVRLQLTVRAGSFFDPEDKVGLAQITGDVLRTGGTNNHDPGEVDRILEDLGAQIDTSVGDRRTTITLSCLKEHFDQVFKLLMKMLRNPAFDDEKITVRKRQMRSSIHRRNDEPRGIARRELGFMLYGRDSVFAREAEPWNLERIDRDAIQSFYERHYQPANFAVGVTGDIDPKKMTERLNETIGKMSKGKPVSLDLPPVDERENRVVGIGHKPDLTKSFVYLAHHCPVERGDEDYGALTLASHILGSGQFASRLFNRVRSEEGLAYATGGGFQPNYGYPGSFSLYVGTKSKTTTEAIQLVLETTRDLTEEPVSKKELKQARDSILNSLVFDLTDPEQNLNRQMRYDAFGVPENWFQTFQKQIRNATRKDVLEAARKYIKPDKFAICVVGNREKIDGDLSQFGTIKEIDISLPDPPEKYREDKTDQAEGDRKKGKHHLNKWKKKLPVSRLQELKGTRRSYERTLKGRNIKQEIEEVITTDGRGYQKLQVRGRTVERIINEDGGWQKMGNRVQKIGNQAMKRTRPVIELEYVNGLLHGVATDTFKPAYLGTKKENETKLVKIRLSSGRRSFTVLLHPETYRVKKLLLPSKSTPDRTFEFGSFKNVNGLAVPHKITISAGGMSMTKTVTSYELLKEVDDERFKSPESGNGNGPK